MTDTTLSGVHLADSARKSRIHETFGVALLLLAPSLVFLALFTYWPVVQVAWQSLTVESFGGATRTGLDNFQRLFADARFARAAQNNIVFAVGTVVPSIVLALAFAVGLQETTRLTSGLRTVFILPVMIPLVAASALFSFIFQPRFGLLDYYLGSLGFGTTNWIGNPDLALWSLMGLTVWKNAGYYMLFFLAGLQAIPDELYESARVEGAKAVQRFRRITLPLLRPTLAFVVVIALLQVLTNVDHIILLTGGGPSDSTNVLLYYIYQQAHENYDIGLAAAATVVTVAALLVISAVSLRTLEHGIHYEG
ncbi:carbohydrate ABC transporter membrane protein 1 (CUT1 family) [Tepidamorphus gemmatus]|uniref:Carbohydrate ABC transporter membrane protein 1 (CUT1 family) n=1 Tax=Tepidamorphus gemmatus TaxID=747076 RepID=A0A4R3M057_9HYPH|nr:sugar ABC transporter permease [Tepidamorphus gemmatus]TCT06434.1 carbohydrate ABC transporter membrane protein 1 (CUT1 family) [Tepidamorphus gemmatus]